MPNILFDKDNRKKVAAPHTLNNSFCMCGYNFVHVYNTEDHEKFE